MNNSEALELLSGKQFAVGGVINDLTRFVDENGDWKTDVKASKMAAIKSSATSVGVDLAAWTGQPAPAV
jgi:hypothetical protein